MCARSWPAAQDRLCRRLVGIFRPPAAGRHGRRVLPPRPALGARRHRLRRHRQLHAAVGLARRRRPCRPAGRRALDPRPRLSAGQHRGRRGLRLVLCLRRRPRCADPHADHRRRHGKPWVFRSKDLRGWWSNPHFDRPGGVETATPTAWVPQSKPIWFTELGCPAVDKGDNQPNVFFDPKSSESLLPPYSRGCARRPDPARYLSVAVAILERPRATIRCRPSMAAAMVDARAHLPLGVGCAALSAVSGAQTTSGPMA